MLKSLYIKNYALIDELQMQWNNGLTAITGETGAGKSIIIGAIQLALGSRADSKVIRNTDQKCIIEAHFVCPTHLKKDLQQAFDLEDGDDIILRREIYPTGKSRSFINDSPRLLTELEGIGAALVAIHQQFDHLDFYDKKFQLEILDLYAGHSDLLGSYQKDFKQYQELIRQKQRLEEQQAHTSKEKEFLEFQLNELNAAQLKAGELGNLEQALVLASKAEDLHQFSLQIHQVLLGENGVEEQLQGCLQQMKHILINDTLNALFDRLENVKLELTEIARELEHIADHSDSNPKALQEINQRLDLLNSLLKKHRKADESELIDYRNEIDEKLSQFESSSDEISNLSSSIAKAEKNLLKAADLLHKQRKQIIPELQEKTIDLLKKLGMEFARIEIQLTTEAGLTETGTDSISFLFSANKGNLPKPLKDQSSGGELARFNLAIKSLISEKQQTTCMIFDEIDTGVSGQIALQMGTILRQIAKNQQVICITHSPQVASRARQHHYVYKEHESSSSQTRMRKLTDQERVIELAKMLSGEPPSKAALSNAKELIAMSDN